MTYATCARRTSQYRAELYEVSQQAYLGGDQDLQNTKISKDLSITFARRANTPSMESNGLYGSPRQLSSSHALSTGLISISEIPGFVLLISFALVTNPLIQCCARLSFIPEFVCISAILFADTPRRAASIWLSTWHFVSVTFRGSPGYDKNVKQFLQNLVRCQAALPHGVYDNRCHFPFLLWYLQLCIADNFGLREARCASTHLTVADYLLVTLAHSAWICTSCVMRHCTQEQGLHEMICVSYQFTF